MATSGSYDFTSTRNELITDSLRKLGILGEGEVASSEQISNGARDLNLMVKAWRNKGINLWCYDTITVFPVTGQKSYSIGPSGDRAASGAILTKLAADAASGAGTVTVDSSGSAANGDVIGIVLNGGTIQWTTINGAPSSNVITLTATLTGAASDDNRVYIYTSLAQRPLRVISGRVNDASDNDTPLAIKSRTDYDYLSYKGSTGTPNQVHYNPSLNNGTLFVWPTFNNVKQVLVLTVQRPVQDFDTSIDNADLPVEWQEAVIWNLARRMLTEYGITDPTTIAEVKYNAEEFLMDAEDFDVENTSMQIIPGGMNYAAY